PLFHADAALVLQPLVFTPITTSAGQQNDVTLQLFNGGADAYLVSASFIGPQGTAGFPAVRGGPVINGFVNVSFALTLAGAYTLSATVYTQGQTVSLTNGLNPAVIVTPGDAVSAQSRVLGLEPGGELVVGMGANFTVLLVDRFDNMVTPNPALNPTVSATFLDSNQVSTPAQFTATGLLFQQNGTQTLPVSLTQIGVASLISFPTPPNVGTVTISVTLSGIPLPGSPFFVSTIPGPPSPQKSTLSGAGLSGAVAGVPAEVMFTPRDEHGNPAGLAGGLVTAALTPAGNGSAASLAPGFGNGDVSDMVASAGGVASGPNVQPGVTVTANPDGTYSLKYTSATVGPYSLSVLIDGQPIGSPTVVTAVAANGPFSAERSFVQGLKATPAGRNSSFQIVAVDSAGRQLTDVTLPSAGFSVTFSRDDVTLPPIKALPTGTGGLFTVPYTLTGAGVYSVSISTGHVTLPSPAGLNVTAPLQLTVWPGPPSEVTSLVTAANGTYRAGDVVLARVAVRDVNNISQVYRTPGFSSAPYRFSITASPVPGCSLESASDVGPFPVTFDSASNVFTSQLRIQTAGQYVLQGALNGVPFRSGSAPLVSVSAGDVNLAKTAVSRLGASLVAGLTSAVRVNLTDQWGNPDVPPGVNCSVTIRTVSGATSAAECVRSAGCGLPFCQRISAGCYFTANLTVSEAGPVLVDVLVDSVPVVNGGMATTVVAGPPAAKASVASFSVGPLAQVTAGSSVDLAVTLRDAFNNSVTTGAASADVILEATLSNNGCATVERINTVEGGSFSEGVVAYSDRPTKPGNLTLRMLVAGEEVPGSKIVVSILPGPTSAAKSDASGAGIYTAIAEVSTSFTVQLRDRFGNPGSQPGDSVNASFLPVLGSPHPVLSPMENLDSGAYRVGYTASAPGTYVVNLTVTSANGTAQAIAGSPFAVTVRRGPAVANLSSVSVLDLVQMARGPPVLSTGHSYQLAITLCDVRGIPGPGQGVPGEPALSFEAYPEPVNQTGGLTPASETSIVDFGNGTVLARFVPYRALLYSLVVQLGGVDVPGGRMVVNVTQGHVAFDQTVVYAAANGEPLIASNSFEVAVIETRDAFGSPVNNNGFPLAPIQAGISATFFPEDFPVHSFSNPLDVRFDPPSGKYFANFAVTKAGVLFTEVNGTSGNGLAGNGLVRQAVTAGPVDPATSLAWGAGLARVLVGGRGRFTLLGYDTFGNKALLDPFNVTIAFTNATTNAPLKTVSLEGVPVSSPDRTSLSFAYTVSPSIQPGQQFKITAHINSRLVGGSPSTVTVTDPATVGPPVADLSLAEGPGLSPGPVGDSTWFDVTLVDQNGTPLLNGNGPDAVSFSMAQPDGPAAFANRACPVEANGTYRCSFVRGVNGTGGYELDVQLLGGGQITGPGGGVLVTGAYSGPSVAERTVLSANVSSVPAGSGMAISVGPRDAEGNPQDSMLQALDELTVTVTGPGKAVASVASVVRVQPSGLPSVSFLVTVQATIAGLYTLRGSLKSGGLVDVVPPLSWNVTSAPADVTQTTVLGSGLASAFAGEYTEVLIIARDAYGNSAAPPTNVSLGVFPSAAATSIAYDEARKVWVGSYLPSGTGAGLLSFEIDGQPFTIPGYGGTWVQAGSVAANQSTAFGPGVGRDEAGGSLPALLLSSTAQFKILATDAFGNPVGRGGAVFDVTISTADVGSPATWRATGVADNGDGTYDVSFRTPPRVGQLRVSVSRGGEQIRGSPFAVSVTGGAVSFNRSVVRFPGRSDASDVTLTSPVAPAGAPLGLSVQLVHGSGRNTTDTGNGTAIAYAVLASDGGTYAGAQLAEVGGGLYRANFTVLKPGPFQVKLMRNGEALIFAGYASFGPADVARSSVVGPSSLTVTAGAIAAVEILAVDSNGNLVDDDTLTVFTAAVSSGNGAAPMPLGASPIPNGTFAQNGRFVLPLRFMSTGQFTVLIQLAGQTVSNGRLDVQVVPGELDPGRSSLDWNGKPYLVAGNSERLTIYLKDSFGNALAPTTTLLPSLSILHYNHTTHQRILIPVPNPTLTPTVNGSGYSVTFAPPTSGILRVSLPVASSDVSPQQIADVTTGKPFEIAVEAGYFDPNQGVAFGPAVDSGAVGGILSYFFVQASDSQGNTVNTLQLASLVATITTPGATVTGNATVLPLPGGLVRVDFLPPETSGNVTLAASVNSDGKAFTSAPVSLTVWASASNVNTSTSVAVDSTGQDITDILVGLPVGSGPTRLFIVARDAQSRDVPFSPAPFTVECHVAGLGPADFIVQTAGNDSGRTAVGVSISVRRAGRYGVSYAVNGGAVKNFTLEVPPGPLDPSSTVLLASAEGTAGMPLAYTVRLYDGNGNLRNATLDGPDPLTVQFVQTTPPDMAPPSADVPTASPDGSYRGAVLSTLAGTFLLRVTSQGATLAQQNVTIVSGPLSPAHLAVANVSKTVTAGVSSTFPILASDEFGNPYQRPDLGYTVTLTRGAFTASFPSVPPRGGDFYQGRFVVTAPGLYNLAVTDDSTGLVVPGSVTRVKVVPGAAAAEPTYLMGSPVSLVGNRVTLTLVVRDAFGNPTSADLSSFNVTLITPKGAEAVSVVGGPAEGGILNPQVEDTLSLGVTPPVSGNYVLRVAVNSTDVRGSPFAVTVGPPAPVQIADVSTGASGSSLIVSFDSATQQGLLGSALGGSCAGLFAPPELAALGAGAACFWKDEKTLRIVTGANVPSGLLGAFNGSDALDFLPGAITGVGASLPRTVCPILATQLTTPASLTPSLTAPGNVGVCHGFTLDASGARGAFNPTLSFVFGVQSQANTEAVVALFAAHDSSQPVVHLPAGTLVPGAVYTFSVSVTDPFGASGVATTTMISSAAPIPLVTISVPPGPSGFRRKVVASNRNLVIESTIALPDLTCLNTTPGFNGTLGNPPRLVLTWTQFSGPVLNASLLAAQTTPTLSLPLGTLAAGPGYGIRLTAITPGYPELTVSDTVEVMVGLPALAELQFSRGVIQTLPADQPLNLSLNPVQTEATPLVRYTWSCEVLSGSVVSCPDSVQALLTVSNETLLVPAGALPVGGYLFHVAVSREALTLRGVTVNAVETQELSAMVYIVEAGQPSAQVAVFDGSEASVLECSAQRNGTEVAGAKYTWQQTSGGSLGNLANKTTSGGRSLVLPKSALAPYSKPRFLCTVTVHGQTSLTTGGVVIPGPLPPFNGGLLVAPVGGSPRGFVFALTASGWLTHAPDPSLTYVYSYRPAIVTSAGGDPLPLTSATAATSVTVLLPPGVFFVSVRVTGTDRSSAIYTAPEPVTVPGGTLPAVKDGLAPLDLNLTDARTVTAAVRQAVAGSDLTGLLQTLGFVAGLSGGGFTRNDTAAWALQLLAAVQSLPDSAVPSSSALEQLACTLAGTSDDLLAGAAPSVAAALFDISDPGLRKVSDGESAVTLSETAAKCYLRLWASLLASGSSAASANATGLLTWPTLIGRGRLSATPLPGALQAGNVSMTTANVIGSAPLQPFDYRTIVGPWTVSMNVSDLSLPAGSQVAVTVTSYAGLNSIFDRTHIAVPLLLVDASYGGSSIVTQVQATLSLKRPAQGDIRTWNGSAWSLQSVSQPLTAKPLTAFSAVVPTSAAPTLVAFYQPSQTNTVSPLIGEPTADDGKDNALAVKLGVSLGVALAALLLCCAGLCCVVSIRRKRQRLHDAGDQVFVFKTMDENKPQEIIKAPHNV
ncbi:hypothetical protein KFL_007600020, partial [Klebsormidium nitens]